jgi:transcriptional regulator of acetoin/glycerol metabolism
MTQEDVITDLILQTKTTLQEPLKPLKEDGDAVSLKDIERQAIIQGYSQVGNNVSLAANRLGISKATLYRKLKEYDISS